MGLDDIAAQRERTHKGHASSRPLSEGYEYLGVAGEAALAEFAGGQIDSAVRPGGDGGVDAWLNLAVTPGVTKRTRVDVKTARKPHYLLVEQGKVDADLYILALFHESSRTATLIGWQWASVVKRAPVSDVGRHGILSHAIAMCRVRPMSELSERIIRD